MPRIVKELPADRPDYTLGDLVYWHVLKFGTRPSVDPGAKQGMPWNIENLAQLIGVKGHTLRNWINDQTLPNDIGPISAELFGNEKNWEDARKELQDKFDKAWTAKRNAAATAPSQVDDEAEGSTPEDTADEARTEPGPDELNPERANNRQAAPGVEDAVASEPFSAGSEFPAGHPPREEERREPVTGPPVGSGASYASQTPLSRRAMGAAAVLTAALLATYGWIQWGRHSARPDPVPPQQTTAQNDQPKGSELQSGQPPKKEAQPAPDKAGPLPAAAPPPTGENTPNGQSNGGPENPATPAPVPPAVTAQGVQPAPAQPEAPRAQPAPQRPPIAPRAPTEEEVRQQEEIARQQAEFDDEMRSRDKEAARLDTDPYDRADGLQALQREAREVAGLGYRLTENQSISGSALNTTQAETASDCARICKEEGCEVFVYLRDQDPPGSRRLRYCKFYSKPFATSNVPGAVLGERIAYRPVTRDAADNASPSSPSIRLAQAGATAPDASGSDGITRCTNGSFKVSGFNLTCDQLAEGGVVRNTDVAFMLPNINQCAAKCQAAAGCAGFTYNASDARPLRTCRIFTKPVVTREVRGWVSGVR